MKYVLRAWEQLQRGLQLLPLGEMCFQAWARLERGFKVLTLGEMCFEGMEAVGKGLGGVGAG